MTHESAKAQGLEPVYPKGNPWAERIFWDAKEGEYYDAYTDLYLYDFDPVSKGKSV